MGESTIQQMIIEAQKHAIDTIKLEPKKRSLKIELLIKKYINLDFMSKATTGSFWKKASETQKEKYKVFTNEYDEIKDAKDLLAKAIDNSFWVKYPLTFPLLSTTSQFALEQTT